jgi:hypothetical protein
MFSICGQEETGCRRKLLIEVDCDVIFIRSYYMEYIVDTGKIRNEYPNLLGKSQDKNYRLSDLGVDGTVIYR